MTLAEFLLARIAEDEAAARAAALHGPVWDDGGPGAIQDARTVVASDGKLAHSGRGVAEVEPHALPHIVRHDPARVLTACEAKRRIVAKAQKSDEVRRHRFDIRGWMEPAEFGRWQALDEVARLLALPYADHSDYREEWKP